MNSDKCFRCGRKGHWARDCVASLGRRGGFLRDRGGETQFRRGGSRRYSCGKTDHIQRDCPQRDCGPRCYRCRGLGHMARDCLEYGPLNAQTQGQRCYICGEKGHIAQDCSMGHLARHCPKDEIKCFNCRKIGHIARDCYRSYRS